MAKADGQDGGYGIVTSLSPTCNAAAGTIERMGDVMRVRAGMRHQNASRLGPVAELARRQHGVISHRQLRAQGMSRSAIQRLILAGYLHPIHRGVYAVGHRAIGSRGRWMGGVLACGSGAVLSHRPAAAHLGIRPMASALIEVTTAARASPPGIKVHHVRALDPRDRTQHEGIPVTTVARTLLDLAELLPPRQLERAIEEAQRRRLFDLAAITATIERSPGRHGLKPLRVVIAAADAEPQRTRSDWERDLLDFCDDHGLRRPELNVTVNGYEVDALWRDLKVIVELDSWGFHRSRAAFESDRARDAALQLAGYRVFRITWRRLAHEPEAVAALLSAAGAGR
jgi:very-short-patch-repair endonuclease